MSEEEDFDLPDLEPDEHLETLVELDEAQDDWVNLMCRYRDKLAAAGFSEEAVEAMVVGYHQKLFS